MNTNQLDSVLVQVRFKHVIKSNQAYQELKFIKRFNSYLLDTIIPEKDKAFRRLMEANSLALERNQEYLTIYKAQQIKNRKCDEYVEKIEFQNKQLRFQGNFLKFGTPFLVVGVGIVSGIAGFYISQAIK